jgi:uncharacterized protein YraI
MRLAAVLAFAAVLIVGVVPSHAEKRVALVIGNSTYGKAPRLPNPANDAGAVAALFSKAGFDVVQPKTNLDLSSMRRVLRDFSDAVRDADVAVVFYAGHGIEVNGVNYLIPVDAALERDIDVEDETVSLERVSQIIAPAKRLRLIILDACRENPFAAGIKRTVASRSIERGLARVDVVTADTLVAFAAKAGSTAADGSGPNSPYTAALLQYLVTPGLDVRLALGRVRDQVLASTGGKQEPFVYGSLGGAEISLMPGSKIESGSPPGALPKDSTSAVSAAYWQARQVGTCGAYAAFAQRFPGTFEATLAEEHLKANCGHGPHANAGAALPRGSWRAFRVLENVSDGVLNMRSGPGRGHDLVAAMPAGAADLSVGECRMPDDGGNMPWCAVEWHGKTGWASTCCMAEITAGSRRIFRVLNDVSQGVLNVRNGPGAKHDFVTSMPAGAADVSVGHCRMPDDGGKTAWCEVEWHGKSGWASACCMVDVNSGAYARAGE